MNLNHSPKEFNVIYSRNDKLHKYFRLDNMVQVMNYSNHSFINLLIILFKPVATYLQEHAGVFAGILFPP